VEEGMEKEQRTGAGEEFWRRHLTMCRRSGLSYAEYCRRNDLTESAFGYWRKKIDGRPNSQSGFLELRVARGSTEGIQVILRNQIKLTVDADFHEGVLSKLVRVLESF
jgi:hypothetical protein